MKFEKTIIGWAYVFSLVVILLFIGNFMALSDIKHDFVNSSIMDILQQDSSKNIPEWASCKFEWGFIQISFILQFALMIIIFVALGKATNKLKV